MTNLRLDLLSSGEKLELEAILAELTRRKIKGSFREWCIHALAPLGQKPAPHHELIIRELEAVAAGRTPRLMLNLPPGSAKSTYASVLFPAWCLAQRKHLKIIAASNTAKLAERFSRSVLDQVRENGDLLGFSVDRGGVEMWDTSNGGAYRSAGVGGTITGFHADLALIDDPVKSRAEAESEVVRESQWNWFTADLRTRLKPGAGVVVIMTRWHPDDLGGRLLERQPGLWRVVSVPAIARENDPLGRQPGEWLWDADPKYTYGAELRSAYAEAEASGAMRDWAALYQQTPTNAEGALFKIGKVETLEAAPVVPGQIVRAWDLAATKQIGTRDPDWTAGVKLQRTAEGRFIVLDVVRVRGGPDEVEATIVNTAKRDGIGVRIGLPQDPGQAGKTQVLYLTRKLAGYRVESSPETGDKVTRAAPAAAQANVGNVSVVGGNSWVHPFLDELAAFPGGSKDDQVDAFSRAFGMVGMKLDYAKRFEALSS